METGRKCFLPLNPNQFFVHALHGHTGAADPCSPLTSQASDFCQCPGSDPCVPGSVPEAGDNQGRLHGPWAWGAGRPGSQAQVSSLNSTSGKDQMCDV